MLAEATGTPCQELSLAVEEGDARLVAHLTAQLGGEATAESLVARFAVTESGFSTPVGRGENANHTLRNDNVVRSLATVGIAQSASGLLEAEATFAVPADWKRDNLRIVGFVQDAETSRVVAVAEERLPEAR